jgi:hypothetical protein
LSLLLALTGPAVTPPAAAAPVGTFRICPVADCSAYPQPGEIKGTTVASLVNWVLYVKAAKAQIREARFWHVNTIRLQLTQDRLVGQYGYALSKPYLNAIRNVVHFALHHGFWVVLNAQTELATGYAMNEPMPTRATRSFWRHMIDVYGQNPRVAFDLFNEPRGLGGWPLWRKSMQGLVSYVRNHGSLNQLWVEGINWASTLAGMPFLRGQGVIPSYHHPGCPHPYQCKINPTEWERAVGYLPDEGVPVIDGEFNNFRGGYYWDRHPGRRVTRYFEFLHYHHIGLVAWTLQPGAMIDGLNTHKPINEPQGAGHLFMRYFAGALWLPTVLPVPGRQSHALDAVCVPAR